jgi:hypothetical protein
LKSGRHEIFIPVKGVDKVMPMVRYLRESGLQQGLDFDFKYQTASLNWDSYNDPDFIETRAGVTFYLKNEKWITFLRIKYSDEINR